MKQKLPREAMLTIEAVDAKAKEKPEPCKHSFIWSETWVYTYAWGEGDAEIQEEQHDDGSPATPWCQKCGEYATGEQAKAIRKAQEG